MTRGLRVLDTGLGPARWNTALSSALLQSREQDNAADILRFYSFSKGVLVGASQPAAEGADIAFCRREGLEIARRITGGGAVYVSPSMLFWDFVTEGAQAPDDLSERVGTSAASALRGFGVAARFRPPNDLIVGERKISGAATTSLGHSFLHQGTLLLTCEIDAMAAALAIPAHVLRGHVSSVHESAPATLDPDAIKNALVDALCAGFGLSAIASQITPSETALATHEFETELGTDAYVLGEDWLLPGKGRA